jgi:putative transposase
MVKTALDQRKADPAVDVPWTGFDLINTFNGWKKTQDAGRVSPSTPPGDAQIIVTGLRWRRQVCQQVFEEAAVDCGRALAAWSDSRSGARNGKRVGFPRFKKKIAVVASFRLRNKHPKGRPPAIRVGDTTGHVRSPCPASARSVCTTTPAGYGACWPTAGPRSCSPPSHTTAAAGGCR